MTGANRPTDKKTHTARVKRCLDRLAAAKKRHAEARFHLLAAVASCENIHAEVIAEAGRLERARERMADAATSAGEIWKEDDRG